MHILSVTIHAFLQGSGSGTVIYDIFLSLTAFVPFYCKVEQPVLFGFDLIPILS